MIVPVPFDLDYPRSSECPRSQVTQQAEDLVQIVNSLMATHESAGVSFGASELPGALHDALRLAGREAKALEAAQDEAVSKS